MPDAEPVAVRGWTEQAWITTTARQQTPLDDDACTPLSPFDSLVWHRPRARRLFDVDFGLLVGALALSRLATRRRPADPAVPRR